MKRKILFIGGAGFIGSHLVKFFQNNNDFSVFVFEPSFSNISRLEKYKDSIKIIRGSLIDIDLLTSIIDDYNIDTVVHLVSTLIPDSSFKDYQAEFEDIIFPSTRLMQICANKDVKFVYFSSGGTIYGNSEQGRAFVEEDSPAPISYYGLSKQILENSIKFENRRENLKYLIIRPSNPFGSGQNINGNQGLIAVSLGKILAKKPIQIWGDGSSVRDYIYIDDLAEAFHQLIINNVLNDTINIGSGFGYSINDIVEKLHNCINKPFNVERISKRDVDVDSMVLNISKLKKYTNVTHTHLEEGIKLFYNYINQIINNDER